MLCEHSVIYALCLLSLLLHTDFNSIHNNLADILCSLRFEFNLLQNKMLTKVELKGISEFEEYVKGVDPQGPIVLFCFTGSKLPSGKSWCGDCNDGMFVINMPKTAIIREDLKDYEDFKVYVDKLSGKGPEVFFLFTGKKKENGRSWCMYCQIAEPVIEAFLTEIKKTLIFVKVDVGDRETWKKMDCPFRVDPRTRLMVIPTIIRWKGVQRLEGEQCGKRELLQMLLEDDD